MAHLHKKFTDSQVKELFERYCLKTIQRSYLQQILGIGKARFFLLLQRYRQNPHSFSIQYHRTSPARSIDPAIELNILKELDTEKKLIQNKDIPLNSYNYTYIKDRLLEFHHQKVSVPTIIRRAKDHGFYLRKPKRSTHDREVLTHYTGELIQHDSSVHPPI